MAWSVFTLAHADQLSLYKYKQTDNTNRYYITARCMSSHDEIGSSVVRLSRRPRLSPGSKDHRPDVCRVMADVCHGLYEAYHGWDIFASQCTTPGNDAGFHVSISPMYAEPRRDGVIRGTSLKAATAEPGEQRPSTPCLPSDIRFGTLTMGPLSSATDRDGRPHKRCPPRT